MSEELLQSKTNSPRMFDAIAKRYDMLNRLLSLGQDVQWRAQLKSLLPQTQELDVLDLATGTADVLIEFAKDNPRLIRGIGVDPSGNMLDIGRQKIEAAGLNHKIILQHGDAQALPFLDETFDCVSISFGIRNIPDLRLGLLEMHRVVKKDGRILILEFSKPSNPLLLAGHWVYMNSIVPAVGFLFSGNWSAYQYLNKTVASFPYGERFCKILRQFGFSNIQAYPLMGGVATIYVGEKA